MESITTTRLVFWAASSSAKVDESPFNVWTSPASLITANKISTTWRQPHPLSMVHWLGCIQHKHLTLDVTLNYLNFINLAATNCHLHLKKIKAKILTWQRLLDGGRAHECGAKLLRLWVWFRPGAGLKQVPQGGATPLIFLTKQVSTNSGPRSAAWVLK